MSGSPPATPSQPTMFTPTAPPTIIVPPSVGGIKNNQIWTGGPRTTTRTQQRLQDPRTPNCYRPTDNNQLSKKNVMAIAPLSQKFSGKQEDHITLGLFANSVLNRLEQTGMDSVFFFTDPEDNQEKNIIKCYSKFTKEDVASETEARILVDQHDAEYVNWSGEFLYNSLRIQQQ
ncbi:MAG: hypothetical protein ACREOZ_02685 [Gloeomargaritales cyanobacterium]